MNMNEQELNQSENGNIVTESLNENDIEKYSKNFSEFDELKKIDMEVVAASSDLRSAKDQLSSIEEEIRLVREDEKNKAEKISFLFRSAKEKEVEGFYDDAEDLYLEILEINDKHARALSHIEHIKTIKDRKEKEREEKELEAKRKSKESMELFESAKRYYREGNFEKSLDELNIALSIGGKNPEVLNYKENCELRIAEINEAMNKAKRESEEKKRIINEYSLASNTHFRDEEYDQGIKLLEKALLIMPDNKEIQEAFSNAEIKYKENRGRILKEKAELKKRLMKIREHQLKAFSYAKNHEFDDALNELEKVLLIDPSDEGTLSDIKAYQVNLLEYKKEQIAKKEKIAKEKHDKDIFLKENYGKGIGFFAVNDFKNAATSFSLVLSVDSHYEDVENYIHRVEDKIKEQDKRDLEFKTKELESAQNIRKIEFEEKKQSEQKIRGLFEDGIRLVSNGDYDSAILKLEKCFSLDSTNEVYLKTLEQARDLSNVKRAETKELEAMLKEEQEKVEELKSKISMLNVRAKNYFDNQMYEEAILIYEEILTIDLENELARKGIINCDDQIKFLADEQAKIVRGEKAKLNLISKMNFETSVLMEERKYEDAIDLIQQILMLDNENNIARENMLNAKNKFTEICEYQSFKNQLQTILDNQDQMLKESRQTILESHKTFLEGTVKDALDMLSNIKKSFIDRGLKDG